MALIELHYIFCIPVNKKGKIVNWDEKQFFFIIS